MFKRLTTGSFYVCVVEETKHGTKLEAFPVGHNHVVDIIHNPTDDPEESWDKLSQIGRGEEYEIPDKDMERLMRAGIDFTAVGRHQTFVNAYNRGEPLKVSICDGRQLKRLRKVSDAHVKSLEDAINGIANFRRAGRLSLLPRCVRNTLYDWFVK